MLLLWHGAALTSSPLYYVEKTSRDAFLDEDVLPLLLFRRRKLRIGSVVTKRKEKTNEATAD
jgi:hypothetical protein